VEKTWLLRLMSMSKKEIVLFSSNSTVNLMPVRVTTIEVVQKLICCVDVVEQGGSISSTYRNQIEGRVLLLSTHFSSKWHIKMLAKTVPQGEPIATPSVWS